MSNIIHKFEEAGLGKAPFTFVGTRSYAADSADGMRRIASIDGCDTFTSPGTSCEYCWTYIIEACVIRSADGKEFVVGCDCAEKTGDKGLVNLVKQAVNKRNTEKRHAREALKIAALETEFAAGSAILATRKHPFDWQAAKGATMLDYYEWLFKNCGNAGKIKNYKEAIQAIKNIQETEAKKTP